MTRNVRLTTDIQERVIKKYGISRNQVLEVLKAPDRTDEIDFQGLTLRIHAKLSDSMEPPCTLVVLESIKDDESSVDFAFQAYPELELSKNLHELRPVEILRLLTNSFGLLIRVGNRVGRLIAQEKFAAPAGKDLQLVESMEAPRGSFSQHLYFKIEEGPPREAQIALAFAIDDELYGLWLDSVAKRPRGALPPQRQDRKSGASPKETKWKMFEKLVAAIHRAEQMGAEVKWNDKINGRQFDVTVRFRAGNYDYLTVVECREKGSPLKASEVDAFVTKSGDAKANKAIMVSSSGFQEGCFAVAELHGVELFTVQEVRDLPADLLERSLLTPALNLHSFSLDCGDESLDLPEQRNILPFLLKEAFIESDGLRVNIERIIDDLYFQLAGSAVREAKSFRIVLPAGSRVSLPDVKSGNTLETICLPIIALSFKYQLIMARYYSGGGLDPRIAHTRYVFRNAVSGEGKVYTPRELEVGFDTIFKPGIFYVDVHTEFCYFCHRVEGNLITLTMLEGYQHGRHLQVTFSVLRENAKSYVEVTDKAEVARLKAMLKTLQDRSGSNFGGEKILDS
jgi:hypothetical protein